MAVAALLVLLSLVAPQIAADRLAPDVSIAEQDIQFSNDFPKALETVTINATVHNIGGMDATAVTVLFYQDNEAIPFNQKSIANIPANGTGVASTSWVGLVPKAYTIHVKTNCTADTNLANNGASRTVTVGLPSGPLVVAVALDPSSCDPVRPFWANGTVKLATQAQPGAAVTITIRDRNGVAVGTPAQTTTDSNGAFAACLTSPAASGEYKVEAGASSGGLNGNATATLRVVLPDLIVTIITFSKTAPNEGDDVKVTATLKNNGTAAAAAFIVAFYDGNSKFASVKAEALPAGNSTQVSATWKAIKGSHQIKVSADPDNKLNESAEDNNALTVPLDVKAKADGGGGNTMMLVGVVVVIAIVAVVAVLLIRRRKKAQ
jgi:hypothetical protein